MSLYKIKIEPESSFCSPLQSDTFFGAFCWSYLYQCGEQALKELLYRYKNGIPDIIFSNAFPSGTLPLPVGISQLKKRQDDLRTKQERYQKYIESKNKENLSYITLEDFNRIINGSLEHSDTVKDTETKAMLWRNMVNRETNTVENIDGDSNLFEIEETFSTEGFDIYIYSTLEKKILENTLREMFMSGIGAQRSIGKGAFKLLGELELFEGFKIQEKSNAFVALSNFVPGKSDPINGYYKTFVKYPKISYTSSETDSPFKKPLIFLKAGSVFFAQPVKRFYGSCIEKVALKAGTVSDEIVIGAYTVAIPCYLE